MGPAQGVGLLDVRNRLYLAPGSIFKSLHLTDKNTDSSGSSAVVHTGNQTGILRTKILDIEGIFDNSDEYIRSMEKVY